MIDQIKLKSAKVDADVMARIKAVSRAVNLTASDILARGALAVLPDLERQAITRFASTADKTRAGGKAK
jgi:hypothetical protein